MTDLQKEELELLKCFIKVCEENNLRYFLIGGTALGAVRHKGFIPWDDDIDVAMPRKDYNKLLKMQDKFPSYYFVQCDKTDRHYTYNFAKIRDSRTTFIESYFKNHRINHGVWIDIFPLDGVSKKMKPAKKFRHRFYYVWFNVFMMYLPGLFRKPKKGTILKDIGLNIVAFLTWWMNFLHLRNRWLDFIVTRHDYDKSMMVANYMGNIPKRAAMPREFFGEGVKLPFEDIEAVCPANYDGYLTWVFHDYMELPPIEKQQGHHYNKGFSLEVDYKEYMKAHKI